MPRRRLTTITLAGLLIVAAVAVALPAAATPHDPIAAISGGTAFAIPSPPAADPFPIRRTFLTGDRLTKALTDAANGLLTRLPREEFEAKVRAASRRAGEAPPRLAETRYKAVLSDDGLTGTAEWRVAGSGLLPLEPLRPAIASPRWADGTPAAIVHAEPTGKMAGAYLVLDRSGDNRMSLNWSARGTEEPGAERFDLAFPPAAIATLELDLPADRMPTVSSPDQLLTGPTPGSSAGRRIWRVAFGGQSQVDLNVRRPHRPGEPGPAIRVNRSARYELSPGIAACTVELELESLRGQPGEFTLEADPGLRITGITGVGRFGWRIEPGKPNRVVVTSSDPATVSRLAVTGFTALPASGAWPCPRLRLVGGLPGTDAVEIRIDPELKFVGLDPGDYRVASAGVASPGYRMSLTGTLMPPEATRADRKPPTVEIQTAGAEYASVEDVTWRVAAGPTALAARFRVRASRGPLVQIPIKVSPNLTVESVQLVPDDPGVPTTLKPGPDGILRVEPTRPLAAGQTVEVRVMLRGPPVPTLGAAAEVGRATLPFPKVTVADAAERVGLFTMTVSPAFRAWPTPAPARDVSVDREATFAYPFRGRPPEGRLLLTPRPTRLSVVSDTTVSLESGELIASTVLTARSQDGEIATLTLFAPGGPNVRWAVQAEGAEVRSLPGGQVMPMAGVLAAVSPWSAALGAVATLPGALWQVNYARPIAGPVTITASARHPADPVARSQVPLPTVFGAGPAPPQVKLAPSAATRYDLAPDKSGEAVTLWPRGTPQPAVATGAGWVFDRVGLVTHVGTDGVLTCVFSGSVIGAAGPTLPVELPAGAELTAALILDRYVDQPTIDDGTRIAIPLPEARPGGTRFEVRYRQPGTPGGSRLFRPVVHFRSTVPKLPAEPGEVSLRWVVAPEFQRWPLLDAPDEPAEGGHELTAVSATAVAALGYAAAALVFGLGVGLLIRGGGRRRVPFVLAPGVAGLGAAVWLVPAGWHDLIHPPLAAGLLVLAGLVLLADRPRNDHSNNSSGKTRLPSTISHAQVAVLVLTLLAATSSARAPEPAEVFVVPGPSAEPDRLSVLAPRAILDRLDTLTRSQVPPVAITAAEYTGSATAIDAPVSFTATYDVLVSGTGESALALPLTGARLEGVALDGQAAYPRTEAQPERYVIAVRGAGRHKVTARFVVPPVSAGGGREVKFGTPDVPCSRVRFTGPVGATQLDVTTRRGARTMSRDGERPKVEADHGGGKDITVRWRDASAEASKVMVSVREACVWDLAESGASAVAAFLYRIEGGSVNRLRIEFPEGLEPGRVTVRSGDTRTGPGLRDWQLGDGPAGWRSLTLGLQSPAEGQVTVMLRFTARRPLGSQTVLRFPRARDVSQSDSFYAVRLNGLNVEKVDHSGVIDYPADILGKEFAPATDLGVDWAPPDRVFQRVGAAAAEVRLTLEPVAAPSEGSADAAWSLGPRADVQGVVRAGPALTPRIEFELPPTIQLDEVRASDLQTWSRTGSRVQVWFKKPTKEALVRWTGSLIGYPSKKHPADPVELELPHPTGCGPVTGRVRAAEGWAMTPLPTAGHKPLAHTPVGEEAFTVEANAAALRVRLFAPKPPAGVDVLETVERDEDVLRYRAVLRVSLDGGRPHQFGLRLVGLPPGVETGVQGPEGVSVGRAEAAGDRAAWGVAVPPAVKGPLAFTLFATVPLTARLPRPTISFGGLPLHWSGRVLAADPGLTATDGPPGWRAAGDGFRERLRTDWPTDAARLDSARLWVADDAVGDWLVTVPPPADPPGAAAVAGGSAVVAPTPEPETIGHPGLPARWAPIVRIAGAAIGWLAVLGVVLALAGWGRRDWWPEILLGCGLLGVTAIGSESGLAVVFGVVAALGLAGRIGWFGRRIARFAMR